MSTISGGFSDRPGLSGRDALVRYGPTILVEIGFDAAFRIGNPERPNIPDDLFPALVDTGASENCIDADFARTLGLPVGGQRDVAGITGVSRFDYFLAQMYVPGLNRTIYGQFAGVRLQAGGQSQYAIVGRDFLQSYLMAYDGRSGSVTISTD